MQTQVVTLDVLKPIGTTVDLSDSFNARVGDKMTPFQLFITEGGVAKDLKGMHPELEAEVGNGALRNGVAVMAAGAKGVHWVGSTNNVTGYNQLTLAFPAEVFPQSGFCYGHLILANDAGVRETSVDIWFQVLDGVPTMGMVADHYDSVLDLEVAKAKNENAQFSQEMRDVYNQQVADAQNALTRATANLSSLAGTAGNIEAQIKAQDIVERPEFIKWSKQMQDVVSKIKPQVNYYADESAMKAANPNGSDGLCITANNNHAWLYVNGIWQDCGSRDGDGLVAARDASQDAMFGQNILNWQKINDTIIPATEDWAHWQDKPLMHLSSSGADNYVILQSDVVPVKYNVVSLQLPTLTQGLQNGDATLEIQQFTASDNPDVQSDSWTKNTLRYSLNNSSLDMFRRDNLQLQSTTTRLRIRFVIAKGKAGSLYVGQPMLNYGEECLTYTPYTLERDNEREHRELSQDLMYGLSLDNFAHPENLTVTKTEDGLVDLKSAQQQASFYSTIVAAKGGSTISLQVPGNVISGDTWLFVQEFQDIAGTQYIKQNGFQLGKGYKLAKFSPFTLDAKTNYITVSFTVYPNSEVVVGMPKLNYGQTTIPYDNHQVATEKDDLLRSSFIFDSTQMIFTNSDNVLSFDTVNHHAKYPNVDFTEIPIKKSVLSLQLPYQNSGPNPIYVQLVWPSLNTNDMYYLWPNDSLTLRKIENIKVPEGVKSVKLRIWPSDQTAGKIGMPKLNYGSVCIPYDEQDSICKSLQAQCVLPRLYIDGMSNAFDQIVPFDFVNRAGVTSGYISYNVQGNSSRNYSKINFKVKLYADSAGEEKLKLKPQSSWKANSKFNIKANWIDATQARNIVNARLITQATAITPLEKPDLTSDLYKSPQLGQMDGFPIEVYFNGDFYGLCTFNLKKDDKNFGMDEDNPKHEVVTVEKSYDAFADPKATIDGKDYATEIHDTASDTLKANFTKLLDFINNSSDEDFKAHLQDYIDVHSVINEMLFGAFSTEYDYYAKSILLATWNDGAYFYMIPYDLDSTWRLDWDGSKLNKDDSWFDLTRALAGGESRKAAVGEWANGNKLLGRVFKLFKSEIKEQGLKLRKSVWSTENILGEFKRFIDGIPQDVYEKEHKRWPALPSVGITDYAQIQRSVIERSNDIDNFLEKLS